MFTLTIPEWVDRHLYKGKNYKDLSANDLNDLKRRLARFSPERPDISVVMPAWNEGDNIYRTLSSLADTKTSLQVELIVINNNSTDHTQEVLNELGVVSYFEPQQGIAFARQRGLSVARGKYHLCADADTFYPPEWATLMIRPMQKDSSVTGVYGRYSFIPPQDEGRLFLAFYERVTGLLVRLRKIKREYINVLGFNMGFVTAVGRETGGFKVNQVRKFDNASGSEYFVEEAEDGRMAINLMKRGRLKLITNKHARVFTSPRRLVAEGGIFRSFMNRVKLHTRRLTEYLSGGNVDDVKS